MIQKDKQRVKGQIYKETATQKGWKEQRSRDTEQQAYIHTYMQTDRDKVRRKNRKAEQQWEDKWEKAK